MEVLRSVQTLTGDPQEVDPGNYNVQQGENLVGLVFVFKDKSNPLLHYEHWYLYDTVQGSKWPPGTEMYVFPSQANPRQTITLNRNCDEPIVEDPAQPSRDAFGFSQSWVNQRITAQYFLAKTEEQLPVGPNIAGLVHRGERLTNG
jgi:hypothetical protein